MENLIGILIKKRESGQYIFKDFLKFDYIHSFDKAKKTMKKIKK